MEIKITGCKDCIFCYEYDMSSGYGCKINQYKSDELYDINKDMDEYNKNRKTIKQSKKWQPITPSWCPLKTESITINFIKDEK